MDKLPGFRSHSKSGHGAMSKLRLLAVLCVACSLTYTFQSVFTLTQRDDLLANLSRIPPNAQDILHKCRQLNVKPGPPKDFHSRAVSDRYEPGTPAVLLKNASIWTGDSSGTEVIHGDLLLDKGLIKAVGNIAQSKLHGCDDLRIINLQGAWVTPG